MMRMKRLRNPASALTHFGGFVFALAIAFPLLHRASRSQLIPLCIFLVGMQLLYAASTLYHALDLSSKANLFLKRLDHMMIFALIAGTYTPLCLLVLAKQGGILLLWLIWPIALIGMVIKFFFVGCPKWVSSVIYVALGWACLPLLVKLWQILPHQGFFALLVGGLFYTVGAVTYALRSARFDARHPKFDTHAVFHLFVLAGSICHAYFMFTCVVPLFPAR